MEGREGVVRVPFVRVRASSRRCAPSSSSRESAACFGSSSGEGCGMVASFWSSVLGTSKDMDLLSLVERWERKEAVKPLKPGMRLRASSFASMCPREEVICSVGDIDRKRVIEADLQLIFLHGTALHWALQNRLLPEIGVLHGEWVCLNCAKVYGTRDRPVLRPEKCVCDREEFVYRERHVVDNELHIGGHLDGLIAAPNRTDLGLFEGKSIGTKGFWEVRQAPKVEHVIQMQVYFWLADLKWGKILYWNKGDNGVNALRVFTVERDDATINQIKDVLRSIWKGIEKGDLPDRICTSKTCPRAGECSVAPVCFEVGSRVSLPLAEKEKAGWQSLLS